MKFSEKKSYRSAGSHEDARNSKAIWFPYSKGGGYRRWYGFLEYYVDWGDDGKNVIEHAKTINKSYTRTIVNVPYFFSIRRFFLHNLWPL
jgi:hypothetical protein